MKPKSKCEAKICSQSQNMKSKYEAKGKIENKGGRLGRFKNRNEARKEVMNS